jgi:hypothetical protein
VRFFRNVSERSYWEIRWKSMAFVLFADWLQMGLSMGEWHGSKGFPQTLAQNRKSDKNIIDH